MAKKSPISIDVKKKQKPKAVSKSVKAKQPKAQLDGKKKTMRTSAELKRLKWIQNITRRPRSRYLG